MVRLGGKSTQRTDPFTLQKQTRSLRRGRADWTIIDNLKRELSNLSDRLKAAFANYGSSNIQNQDILDHLEFEDNDFYAAFQVPRSADGMIHVGRNNKKISPDYLLYRWAKGWDAGIFKHHPHVSRTSQIWDMSSSLRRDRLRQWKREILTAQVADIYTVAMRYNACQSQLDRKSTEDVSVILASKRIIGCTTTAAAKYSDDIRAASPGVLLVEEAGEILESHVLTAMGPETTQLILIGDHK